MRKIIYIKPVDSTFIRIDQAILEKHFVVIPYLMKIKKNVLYFGLALIKLFFFIIIRMRKTNAIITWFGDYHAAVIAFVGKLFNKKVVVFVGGMDSICYPEFKKGVFCNKFRGKCVAYALKNASLIIPNHKSLVYHENYYYDNNGKKDGIKYYIHDLKTKIEVIPNGYDIEKFKRDTSIQKSANLILTIGKCNNISDVINKGFDLFVQVARRSPLLEFVIIAIGKEHIPWLEEKYKISELKNLTIIPYSYHNIETLKLYYNQAKVFVQASITEGMPNTLGEAMLYECIPVGSNVNGIPDTIGNTGVIVYHRDIDELGNAIKKALTMNTGKEARERIIENFSLEKREIQIMNAITK
jgi:glycosyltransferase involved in cell wall biosynthesis